MSMTASNCPSLVTLLLHTNQVTWRVSRICKTCGNPAYICCKACLECIAGTVGSSSHCGNSDAKYLLVVLLLHHIVISLNPNQKNPYNSYNKPETISSMRHRFLFTESKMSPRYIFNCHWKKRLCTDVTWWHVTPVIKPFIHWSPVPGCAGARPIYWFADIIDQYWTITEIRHRCICSLICTNIKTFFLRPKNNCDLKWCNYVDCPAEGGQLFNK